MAATFFPFQPEQRLDERLDWRTDIHRGKSGVEQRHSTRRHPRQSFVHTYLLEDAQAARMEAFLFGTPVDVSLPVGVWQDAAHLTAEVSAGATAIPCTSTLYRDFRVGGKAIVWEDYGTAELITISAKTATQVTASGLGLLNSYTPRARVMPALECWLARQAPGARWANNLTRFRLTWQAKSDQVNDISDTSAFPAHGGKVLIEDANVVRGTSPSSWAAAATIFDPGGGAQVRQALASVARLSAQVSWSSSTRQRTWEIKQLLYALRGRQTSFWLPSHRPDLRVRQDLGFGGTSLPIDMAGYTQWVAPSLSENTARELVRVTLVDGTQYLRTITGASENSETEETLNLSESWPATIPAANVQRVEYVDKVRLDSDSVLVLHGAGEHSTVTAPVRMVLD